MTVRTRIAPSPTGDPHVGTAYVALFNTVFWFWYIKPYQQATGTPAFAEVMLLAAGWLVWGGTAIGAWWMIRRSYQK